VASTVSIIGASGAVGTTLASQILRSDLLAPLDRLQLVAHGVKKSSDRLLSDRIDLMDAFDDKEIDIEVVANFEDVDGDVVVICAGIGQHGGLVNRRDWGEANVALFAQMAEICAQRVPNAFFVIVSNPVELAVRVFAERLGSDRVAGMGAEQDSLRFARAIAHDLGTSRHYVTASVLGEHGRSMVPLWSSVHVSTMEDDYAEELDRMKEQSAAVPLEERVAKVHEDVLRLVEQEDIDEAYAASHRALPDARIFLQPLITYRTMRSTPNATANSTLRFLQAALSETSQALHGQVLLSGEFLGIHGVCGVPLRISRAGWEINQTRKVTSQEQARIVSAASSIEQYLSSICQEELSFA
jgi:malate dehydrogenase